MRKIPYRPELHSKVADFECGEEPYQREVSEWIRAKRGEGGALDALRYTTIQIWLYETEEGELIGFSSFDIQRMKVEGMEDTFGEIYTIPYLGLHSNFHGKPEGDENKEQRYSKQILRDVLNHARSRPEKLRWLGLYVNPRNSAAIQLYQHFRFEKSGEYDGDDRMIKDLNTPDHP